MVGATGEATSGPSVDAGLKIPRTDENAEFFGDGVGLESAEVRICESEDTSRDEGRGHPAPFGLGLFR